MKADSFGGFTAPVNIGKLIGWGFTAPVIKGKLIGWGFTAPVEIT